MKRIIRNFWEDFWYDWHFPEHFSYGGSDKARKVFKKQRLFNVIVIIIITILLAYEIF